MLLVLANVQPMENLMKNSLLAALLAVVAVMSGEALAQVRNSIECCNAAFRDFFAAMQQDDGAGKTSKKRR